MLLHDGLAMQAGAQGVLGTSVDVTANVLWNDPPSGARLRCSPLGPGPAVSEDLRTRPW